MTDRLHVATLNIRNIADRWEERLPLLLADMRALQPDVIGLQEVVYPMEQDRLLGAAGEARYRAIRAWAGRPEYGNSLLVREPLEASAEERLDLGRNRSAIRVLLRLPGGAALLFTSTHLHHVPADESVRDEQAALLVDWLAAAPAADVQVLVGDFNAEPDEPAPARLRSNGLRSAYLEANGAEPAVTWPSGIQAPGMDTEGDPGCLDYIWLLGNVRATDARLIFDRPAAGDPTLYASDHLGIAAHIVVGE
jgi:endonuclease/exonuclease/phosphatase family metal-dependent hydrolase